MHELLPCSCVGTRQFVTKWSFWLHIKSKDVLISQTKYFWKLKLQKAESNAQEPKDSTCSQAKIWSEDDTKIRGAIYFSFRKAFWNAFSLVAISHFGQNEQEYLGMGTA